jgi:signal transduction histidine kinase
MPTESELLAEIESLKTQLASAQAEQWKLIRLVCHELRLPLTTIKGYNDLLPLMGLINDQQKDFVTRIKKNVGRMTGMIAHLHELAYMGEGHFTVNLSPVSPAEVIEKVCRKAQSLADERGNTLAVNVPDTLPAVQADSERLEQILCALVENALMYTPGGGRVTVAASPADDARVQIAVSDTGIGVAEGERDQLFTLFFRGDAPLVREQVGAGMNLYMLRRFVEYMGGAYGAEFPEQGGSRFWVRLPASSCLVPTGER